MLTIYNGSVQEVKARMKEESKEATDLRRYVEKKIKWQGRKKKEDIKDLDQCDRIKAFMVVSKFIPVWVDIPGGSILMNYLMIKDLAKRLKGYKLTVTVTTDVVGRMLVFRYTNGKRVKGRFQLYELPQDIFNLGNAVPKARFDDFVNMNVLEGVI